MNFRMLDDLIRSGVKEIALDSDIILDRNHEDAEYPNGISVDVEDLVIDGQGHAIDARQRTRIFNITGSVVLKNLTLKNGFAKERGCAIHTSDDCNLNIFGCRFVSNTAGRGPMFSTGGAIYCSHDTVLDIQDTHFESNVTMHSGAIDASRVGGITDESGNFLNKMKIINCTFKDNKPDDYMV